MTVLACTRCQKRYLPQKYVCERCGNAAFEEVKIKGGGEILSYTTIRVPPEVYKDQAPYDLALVALTEAPGLKVTARLLREDERQVKIGDKVELAKVDEIGPWFRLA